MMKKERLNEIWGVFFLLLGVFTFAGLFFYQKTDIPFFTSHPASPIQNYTGIIGAYLAFALRMSFGLSSFIIPAIFVLWAFCFFKQNVPEKKFLKFIGLAMAIASTSIIITLCTASDGRFDSGGALGYVAGSYLLKYFGFLGSFILATSVLLLSLLLATDFLLYPMLKSSIAVFAEGIPAVVSFFVQAYHWVRGLALFNRPPKEESEEFAPEPQKKPKKAKAIKTQEREASEPSEKLANVKLKVKKYRPTEEEEEEKSSPAKKSAEKSHAPAPKKPKLKAAPVTSDEEVPTSPKTFDGVIGSDEGQSKDYELPSKELLTKPLPAQTSDENLEENSAVIENTLAEFGIEVKVVEVEQGPVITRYELLPAPGVKVNSISNLQDDLSLALKAHSIRMIIPIPGKSAIGIEVPNAVTNTVYLKELIETNDFQSHKAALPLVLGKNTSGKPLIADLASMPHLLIAGTTGSGKSVCVNAIVMGLLNFAKPSELKFVMVDPKMVEMNIYNDIPHMLTPVITDVKKAANAINWVVAEMEKRYRLLAKVGVKNITSFNSRPLSDEDRVEVESKSGENIMPASLPYIVVIIDELADLMMTMRDKVEAPICRLAQLSRAVGIHLILATQRPSVDVITGVIKANFPARISFKVSSKVDSRTVLDAMGAESLIGRGDMLFLKPGDAKPMRGQAPFVGDDEIKRVVDYVTSQGEPEYHEELSASQDDAKSVTGADLEKDELYDEAWALVLETGQASASFLQRRMRLGFSRASRIIDQMEMEGKIGPSQGSKPREIYQDELSAYDEEESLEEELID